MIRRSAPEPVARIGGDGARRHRLARQHLDAPTPAADAERVVADLAGLHAQLASSASSAWPSAPTGSRPPRSPSRSRSAGW